MSAPAPAIASQTITDGRLDALDDTSFDLLPAKLQWKLAGYFRAAGDYQRAALVLTSVERRGGESMQLLEERARLAFARGQMDDARRLLEDRVERAPSATARVALARFYIETDRLDDAVELSRALSRENPDLVGVCALAADLARARGEIETARSYYLGVVDARPDQPGGLFSLARLSLDDGDRDAAAAFLRRALTAAGEEPTTGQCLIAAEVTAGLGEEDRAEEFRRRARTIEQARTEALIAEVDSALGERPAPRPQPKAAPQVTKTVERPVREAIPEEPPEPALPTIAWNAGRFDGELDPRVDQILNRDFGHAALRPGQAAVIANVMADHDTLAIMPTGAGKSLTFQLPAMLRDGTTLVISPLIALMKDQVESLPTAVRDKTALINSTLSPEEFRGRLADLREGRLKLVYVAPERLRDHAFLRALRLAGTSLVVIDEAHCISMWGHDFRPDYLFIPKALPELGDPSLLAITATATPAMATQIGNGLGRKLDQIRISIFRPNLFYEVHQLDNREKKVAKVLDVCRREQGNGIVYVGSRKDAESIAGLLRDNRVAAIPYHAGLPPEVRSQNQERFMRGQVRVVVATVAFGMGVDKADVRFIVHLSPPASLESYAQESGRAGRDGRPARCILLASPTDEANLKRMARRDEIDLESLRKVYTSIKRAASGQWAIVGRDAIVPPPEEDQEDEVDPRVALGILDQAGLLLRHPDAPLTYELRRQMALESPGDIVAEDEPAWNRFVEWLGPERLGRPFLTIRTAEACAATGLTPVELDRLLTGRTDLRAREGPRSVCLELLPVAEHATATLTRILERAKSDADRRIRQVMAYVRGSRCRHVLLAAHLGEQLEPCGGSCDICASKSARKSGSPVAAVEEKAPAKTGLTVEDVLVVLDGVRTLPFSMGKTGLVKLLMGSVESRVRADRSRAFGVLAGLKRGQVDGLIDRLVDDGLLYRDLNHEYKIISLTSLGAEATAEDLASYVTPAKSLPRASSTATSAAEDQDLTHEDQELFDQLVVWRRERASTDGLPPYVVAHNSMLRNLAVTRPTTAAALGSVPGFGSSRVERYGSELLRLIAAAP